MKTKILGFVVLVLILSTASAFCAEWKLVGYGMTPNGEKQFDSYMGSSERTAEGTIKVHIKQVYTPTGIKDLREQLPNCSYTVFTFEMSCSTEEFRVIKMADFDKDDKMLASYTQGELAEADWRKIGAGSLAEIYFEDLCGKTLKPQTK